MIGQFTCVIRNGACVRLKIDSRSSGKDRYVHSTGFVARLTRCSSFDFWDICAGYTCEKEGTGRGFTRRTLPHVQKVAAGSTTKITERAMLSPVYVRSTTPCNEHTFRNKRARGESSARGPSAYICERFALAIVPGPRNKIVQFSLVFFPYVSSTRVIRTRGMRSTAI